MTKHYHKTIRQRIAATLGAIVITLSFAALRLYGRALDFINARKDA